MVFESDKRKWLWIGAAAGVVVIAAAVTCILVFVVSDEDTPVVDVSGPETAARAYLDAMETNDIEAMLALMDPEDLNSWAEAEGTSLEEFKQLMIQNATDPLVQFANIELQTEMSDDGTTAGVRMVSGTVVETGEDGTKTEHDVAQDTTWSAPVSLILRDGQWYIDMETEEEDSPEAVARALILDAVGVIEAAYAEVDTYDPSALTPEVLNELAPTITFKVSTGLLEPCLAPSASAWLGELDYYGDDSSYSVGCVSQAGTTFGIHMDNEGEGVQFYVNGAITEW